MPVAFVALSNTLVVPTVVGVPVMTPVAATMLKPAGSGAAVYAGRNMTVEATDDADVEVYAGGLAFGFWAGSALALEAMVLGCVADFTWARLVARDWAQERMHRAFGGRLARMDAFLAANPGFSVVPPQAVVEAYEQVLGVSGASVLAGHPKSLFGVHALARLSRFGQKTS